jgi:fructose-bisphosphate aldolase class II
MALVSLRQLLDYAAEHSFAVPAFNVSNIPRTKKDYFLFFVNK